MRKILGEVNCSIALEKIFEINPDALIVTDNLGRIIRMNPRAVEMFGYYLEEAIGENVHSLLAPPELHEKCKEGFSNYQKTGLGGAIGRTVELCAVRKGGELFPIELSLKDFPLENGLLCAIASVRDISERKRKEREAAEMQERLLRMETSASLSMLSSSIAHDFNNILTAAMGFASMLEQAEGITEEKKKHFIKMIIASIERACALAGSLLRIGKVSDLKQPLVINDVIDDICSILINDAHKKGVVISKKLQPVAFIAGSYGLLSSVVLNVITNAIQAMEKSEVKNLEVSTENVDLKEETDGIPEGKYVLLCVSDTGCGMSEEVKKKIFENFFTTKSKGSGIGIKTTRVIVKMHDGHLKIDSEIGKGTKFVVYFPCIVPEDIL